MNPALAFVGIGLLVAGLVYQFFGRKLQAANDKANQEVLGSRPVEYSNSSARYAAPILMGIGVLLLVVSFFTG